VNSILWDISETHAHVVLDRFQIGQNYPCWCDPNNPHEQSSHASTTLVLLTSLEYFSLSNQLEELYGAESSYGSHAGSFVVNRNARIKHIQA